ncbi:MAG TPA: reverse transcriptase-like protein [Candidatus Nitrosotenuis sp.]|nr:reverse transcriptase-like protein [Candidatus Nitrosotenuis sp.]
MKHAAKHPVKAKRLFDEPSAPSDLHVAHVDGAARGNPGPAAYGVVVRKPDGSVLRTLSKYIGRATNNVAEYYGLIAALDFAAAHGIRRLRVRSDSELLVRQMHGRYKVKSADLRPLFERAKKLAASFEWFQIEHVFREANAEADALCNAALDAQEAGAQRPFDSAQGRAAMGGAHVANSLASTERKIRARYSGGVLQPAEPLDLPEGAEIEITIRRR